MKECFDCKETFDRVDVWPHPQNPEKFICRGCKRKLRLREQTPFESEFRNFRHRKDYVPQEGGFQASRHRISDEEFDKIVAEFEQAHWSDISAKESQTHHRYIESLFQREFWQRVHTTDQSKNQEVMGPDMLLYYSLLGMTMDSSDSQVKEAYRKLVLKWHPDKNPIEPKYAEKMLISVKIAFEKIMESRKRNGQVASKSL